VSSTARRGIAVAGVIAMSTAALAACGSSGGPVAGATQVSIKLTDKGCEPDVTTAPAGPVTFTVIGGSSAVTEAELMKRDRVLAEKENIAAGLTRTFSASLQPGTYTLYCKGGKGAERVDFIVTAALATNGAKATAAAALTQAGVDYATYVKSQTALLLTSTKTFTDAVRAGNVAAAKAAYPLARVYYERIEPVAESFGDLDPDIDARSGDVSDQSKWTGFHRIEKALWIDNSTAGMTPMANGLDDNVAKLNTLVQTLTFDSATIANGAGELLDEVGKSKITGEEENYSHIDLVDFVGNVDGSKAAFDALKPGLQQLKPDLADKIQQRFDALYAALAKYKTGSGPADYRNYSEVSSSERKSLAAAVDALAEPISTVAGIVVRG